MLVRVARRGVVALVAGEHFGAAREAEPAVGFAVVGAAAAEGEFVAGGDAEGFSGCVFAWGRTVFGGGRVGEEEFCDGDVEG